MHIHFASPIRYRQPPAAPAASWTPPVDVLESDTHYVIRLDAPGVDDKGVSVELEQGVLRVTGERRPPEEDGARYTRRERRAGAFHRRFRLPEAIDADAIEAKFDRGTLEIRIPKVERSRKIPVQ